MKKKEVKESNFKEWFSRRIEFFPFRRQKRSEQKRPLIAQGTIEDRITHLEDQIALIEVEFAAHREKSYYAWVGIAVALLALIVNILHDFIPGLRF